MYKDRLLLYPICEKAPERVLFRTFSAHLYGAPPPVAFLPPSVREGDRVSGGRSFAESDNPAQPVWTGAHDAARETHILIHFGQMQRCHRLFLNLFQHSLCL